MRMATTTAKKLLNDPVTVTVRFEGALLRQLQESAKRSLRSVNAEINHQLRSSLERKTDKPFAA
jgi:hypothetical protein